jgi:circadian clock protein KaiC
MNPTSPAQVPTGIAGLDRILHGGLPAYELYLVTGKAGTGKTTLALQFLRSGIDLGQRVLYVTLSQTAAALHKLANSHGWSLEGADIYEITSFGVTEQAVGEQTIFRSAEVELGEVTAEFFAALERVQPERLVFDSLVQLRLLANDSLRFQRQLFALRQYSASRRCTAMLIDVAVDERASEDVQDLTHGVVRLERWAPNYGNVRRRLLIAKMRGLAVHGGYHNFTVRTGGLEVYPRLVAGARRDRQKAAPISSGLESLDMLLDGGLEAGSTTLILGATGTGKTSLATLYAKAAAQRGDRVSIFLFEERFETFFARATGLGMDLRSFVERGLLTAQEVIAGDLSPGEFSEVVRRAVDQDGARVVLIDSLSGYFHAMPQEEQLLTQMHELLSFLSANAVLALLIAGQHGIAGQGVAGPLDISYLCDTLLLLRHFDSGGEIRKTVAVIKKRSGPHESTIRELRLDSGGILVGQPLRQFEGLLTGTPHFHGELGTLLTGEPPNKEP